MSSTALFATLLATGFLGSLGHCIGMCGPLVTMVSLRAAPSAAGGAGAADVLPAMLRYHAARIGVYGALGAAGGAIGSLVGIGAHLNMAAAGVSLFLGVAIILFGAAYLGWRPLAAIGALSGKVSALFDRETATVESNGTGSRSGREGQCLTGTIGRLLGPNRRPKVIVLGALNGLLPCGLVYSALLVASSSGTPASSALGMLLFGIGTVPVLLLVGTSLRAMPARTRLLLARGAGFLIMLTGLQLVLRAMAALGIVPALRIGSFVLW